MADEQQAPARGTGRLVLAATPIGNDADASPRLRALLSTADVIAAEDTRRLRRLLAALAVHVSGRIVSYHEHNERLRTPELLDQLMAGAVVAVVSDAGMPTLSDPGHRLVARCAEHGLPVSALPGPSAVPVALAVSGLPTDRYCFEGFLPRRPGEQARLLAELATERRTMVFFESPLRTGATLAAMAAAFGSDRRGCVCRELTKTHEEIRRGSLGELCDWAARGVLGEVTLVVAGAAAQAETDLSPLVDQVMVRVAAGERLKDAVTLVAGAHGVARRRLYEAALRSTPSGRHRASPKTG